GGRDRAVALRRRRVRPRVHVERHRARRAGSPRRLRRGDQAGRARLVRPDARLLLPGGTARAAAVRALAARLAAADLLAVGRAGRLGGHPPAAPGRDGGTLRAGPRRTRRRAGQELDRGASRRRVTIAAAARRRAERARPDRTRWRAARAGPGPAIAAG